MFYTAEFWEMFLSNYAIRRSWQKHLGFVLSTSIKTLDQCRCGVGSCLCKNHNKPLDYEISIANIMRIYNKLYQVLITVETFLVVCCKDNHLVIKIRNRKTKKNINIQHQNIKQLELPQKYRLGTILTVI